MTAIEVNDHHVLYDNPAPQNRSRHGYFPGLTRLPSGDLLALFVLGEAFEASDCTTTVARSKDQGRTWELESPLHEKEAEHAHDSDYMKPTLLQDGTLLATGYRFHRTDPEQPIANAETDGVRGGDNLVAFSRDEGRTWTAPDIIPRSRPEMIEASGPTIQTRSGAILGCGSLFPRWDGTNPSGKIGVLIRSEDGGKSWDDQTRLFAGLPEGCAPSEPRLCEMADGRIVALGWIADHRAGVNLPNHVTVSHDGGVSWSAPLDTRIRAQASHLIHWRDDLLLTVHSHREGEDIGVYVRLVDFAGDEFNVIEAVNVWDNAPSMQVGNYATMGTSLRFGQPSLLRLDGDEVLATHWAIEEGQGRIRSHRLRVHA